MLPCWTVTSTCIRLLLLIRVLTYHGQIQAEPEEPDAGGQKIIDMNGSLDISGLAHGLHNISKRMVGQFRCFDAFKEGINAITYMLHCPWTRKRFLAQCVLLPGPYAAWVLHFR